jgi:hypothetical protein
MRKQDEKDMESNVVLIRGAVRMETIGSGGLDGDIAQVNGEMVTIPSGMLQAEMQKRRARTRIANWLQSCSDFSDYSVG